MVAQRIQRKILVQVQSEYGDKDKGNQRQWREFEKRMFHGLFDNRILGRGVLAPKSMKFT